MLTRDPLECLGADLLLALDEKTQRDRHVAKLLQGLEGVDTGHHVGLVVGDAPREDPAVMFRRLKWRRAPKVDGINRLHVVVLVQQQLAATAA